MAVKVTVPVGATSRSPPAITMAVNAAAPLVNTIGWLEVRLVVVGMVAGAAVVSTRDQLATDTGSPWLLSLSMI